MSRIISKQFLKKLKPKAMDNLEKEGMFLPQIEMEIKNNF